MGTMKTIDITNATAPLSQYARELDQEPLVLTDGNQPIAALMPIDEADLDSVALGSNAKFLALLEQARAQRRAGAGLSTEEVRRELGL
jgi:antitoxin (DNA-binding transcriptional repressor) of toxin-antitoxin stability system